MIVCSIFRPSAHSSIKSGLETNSRWQLDHYIIKLNLLLHINSTTKHLIVFFCVMTHLCISGKNAHCVSRWHHDVLIKLESQRPVTNLQTLSLHLQRRRLYCVQTENEWLWPLEEKVRPSANTQTAEGWETHILHIYLSAALCLCHFSNDDYSFCFFEVPLHRSPDLVHTAEWGYSK